MKLRSNVEYGEHKQKILRRIFVKKQQTNQTEPEEQKRGETSKNNNRSGENKREKKP